MPLPTASSVSLDPAACDEAERVVTLFDIPIWATTLPQVLDKVRRAVHERQSLHIGVVNAAKIVNMQIDSLLKRDVLASDIILADGSSVVMASRVLGRPLPERVTGIDLMYGMLEQGRSQGYRVYCLGATEAVSRTVARRIAEDYPGVVLAGRRNGYFADCEAEAIARDIAEAKPDILLVAMTSPKKEEFMARWQSLMAVPVVHGVGGSFDVMAGKVQRAPLRWQRLGLEWLYRVCQEPRRLWRRYLVTNSLFCWMVIKYKLTGGGRRR